MSIFVLIYKVLKTMSDPFLKVTASPASHLVHVGEEVEFSIEALPGTEVHVEFSIDGETVLRSFDITIPYNNRCLLELLLAVPIEMRIQDILYQKIRTYTTPAVDEAGVAITNLKHTNSRAKVERVYLEIHSKLPV